jgi:TrmH family RNA methyltransferase
MTMNRIESKENQTYKSFMDLRVTRKSRTRQLVLLEGFRLCGDALQSGMAISAALVSDSAMRLPAAGELLGQLPGGIEVYSLPDHLFSGLCSTENPQGIALICKPPLTGRPDAPPKADGLYLVAAEIQDPGNLGNMIRTADAFAFDGVLMTAGTVFPFNNKVLRAAMGSCFHVPLITFLDLRAISDWLATSSTAFEMIAADPGGSSRGSSDGAAASWPTDWPVPAALVIGNEARGLPDTAGQICLRRVAIPMPGRAESLNAASAAAVLCFELMLARLRKQPVST